MSAKDRHTIGTDPEFFVKKGKKFISAIRFIGDQDTGTKYNPLRLSTVENASVQRDNVAVEFASPPAETPNEFVESIRACLREVKSMLPKGATLEAVPSAHFPPSELKHPEARQFGCDPDYNAWKMEQNEAPRCSDATFRSCGGHVHVGGIRVDGSIIPGMEFLLTFEGKIQMVKAMDILLGIPSTILDCSEEAVARRKLYGKAGCHRIPEHGVEYRVLSNYWLKSPELVMLIYSLTQDAVNLVKSGALEEVIEQIGASEIQRVINKGDRAKAMLLVEQTISRFMSRESQELFALCLEKVSKVKTLSEEWGI